MQILQKQGSVSKGGPDGVKDLGSLKRVPTGLGVDIAVPQESINPKEGASANYVITAIEHPNVDAYVFEELSDMVVRRNLSLDQIEELVEEERIRK